MAGSTTGGDMADYGVIRATDPKLAELLVAEEQRQATTIDLIPSENYASPAVLSAIATVTSAKYAEGYPGKRYYQGGAVIDQIERLAIERARELFGVEHVNVQPHSGAEANHAVYYALCEPGDTTVGLDIPSGGHLTHGAKPTFVARYYNPVTYRVDRDTELIDYDALAALVDEHRPRLLMMGTSSYPRAFDWPRLAGIAHAAGAYLVADIAHVAGLVAGGALPSPLPHADVVTTTTHKTLRGPRGALIMTNDEELARQIDRAVFPGLQGGPHEHHIAGIAAALHEAGQPPFSAYARRVLDNAATLAAGLLDRGFSLVTGGTDNHLMVLQLPRSGVAASGRKAARALEAAGLVANSNAVPYDPATLFNPSGVRYGTPAVTTCGMGPAEMRQIAAWTERVLRNLDDDAAHGQIRDEVRKLRADYPLPR
jgi:glycine hydroxymethyltransferase